jgi:hypothetical protein
MILPEKRSPAARMQPQGSVFHISKSEKFRLSRFRRKTKSLAFAIRLAASRASC